MNRASIRRRRARQRGAALVEAAVVMPVLCTFLGMTYWFHDLYQNKQNAMYQSRSSVLKSASHGCDSSDDGSSGNLGGDADGAKGSGDTGNKMSMSFNTIHDSKSYSAKGMGNPAGGWSYSGSNSSACMCNEKYVGNSIGALVSYGVNLVKSRSPF